MNTFYCSAGRYSFRGWILLPRYEYAQLDPYSNALQLNIGDTTNPNNLATLQNLSIVQARCVTRGLITDPNAIYLIELTDDRGILHNEWFQAPVTSAYNIRAPAYPDTFHPGSMNGGTTWTWDTMCANLWAQMNTLGSGSILGPYPGLPTTPASTPEGFWFPGTPCWYALNDILEHLGLSIAANLTLANPYTIVQSGATDNAFTTLQTKYLPNLEDDLEWLDKGSGRVPLTIKVLFRRRNTIYGTEETVRYDTQQWDMTPYYSVTLTAPAVFAAAVGAHYIWSSFTVRYDQDGVPLPADTAMAATIAQERVNQYFGKIYDQTSGFLTQRYAGSLPFTTGSRVDGVCWRMVGDAGWATEVIRGPDPPWPALWDSNRD